MGDFNAHHTLWSFNHTDNAGALVADLVEDNDLITMNHKIPTAYNYRGHSGVLDLTFLSPVLALKASYERVDDPMRSDHYPLVVEIDSPSPVALKVDTRWVLRADWPLFQNEVEKRCSSSVFIKNDVDGTYKNITNIITDLADIAVPRTSGKARPRRLAYWCDAIKAAIAARKKAFKKWCKHRSLDSWIEFKRCKALAQREIRLQAAAHRRGFCEGLDPSSPASAAKVWRAAGAMLGGAAARSIPSLVVNGVCLVSARDKAEAFGAYYAAVSADAGYDEPFASLKRFMYAATRPLFGKTEAQGNSDVINSQLTFGELKRALASSRSNTARGPDSIPYILLKNLTPSLLHIILKFYNNIWTGGLYPKSWRTSIVIPMLKQNKPRNDLNSYRPIALTNCLAKLLEKMANNRLKWHLENKQTPVKGIVGIPGRKIN